MLSEEVLRKVRQIEIVTHKVMDDLVSGQYRSHFRGQGVQFSEHRQYMPGDDVRHIDWKVSARTKDPLVKKYEEERELSVLLLVDISGSNLFGSQGKTKGEVLAEVAGLIAYAASLGGDKVGLILFAGGIEKILPLKKGRAQVQRIVRELIVSEPRTRGTDMSSALKAAGRLLKHSGIIFVLSDFRSEEYEKDMARLARRHDVVAVRVADPLEKEFSLSGEVTMVDPETGDEIVLVAEGGKAIGGNAVTEIPKAKRIEVVDVTTAAGALDTMVRFFQARGRRRR